MRTLILLAALGLAGCGDDQAANNTAVAEEGATARVGAGNDATAIDAATGQAADMAADVDYTFNEVDSNVTGGDASANSTGNNAL